MEDYKIVELTNLINEVLNPVQLKSEALSLKYTLLHSSVFYFEYAVAATKTQERALLLLTSPNEKDDHLIVGSAISAYQHMDSSLRLFDAALIGISNEQLKILRGQYREWKKHIKYIRDRVAAHPEEDEKREVEKKFYVMSKRQMISTDGRVAIQQIAVKSLYTDNMVTKIILTPRNDLEELRKYLTEISVVVKDEFSKL